MIFKHLVKRKDLKPKGPLRHQSLITSDPSHTLQAGSQDFPSQGLIWGEKWTLSLRGSHFFLNVDLCTIPYGAFGSRGGGSDPPPPPPPPRLSACTIQCIIKTWWSIRSLLWLQTNLGPSLWAVNMILGDPMQYWLGHLVSMYKTESLQTCQTRTHCASAMCLSPPPPKKKKYSPHETYPPKNDWQILHCLCNRLFRQADETQTFRARLERQKCTADSTRPLSKKCVLFFNKWFMCVC